MTIVTDRYFYMDGYLMSNLNSIIYNLNKDWDFILLVTGDGMTRVGKSLLSQQIGYFVSSRIKTKFDVNNIVFSGAELIEKGKSFPHNSVFIYDEARGELNAKMQIFYVCQNLLSFFAECGMYNHFIIVVLPDFFELPFTLALNRSEALINVYREKQKIISDGIEVQDFKRGYFDFYNREGKRKLWMEGKKNFNLYLKKFRSFYGTFPNQWIIEKEEYLSKKIAAFDKRGKGRDKQLRALTERDAIIHYLNYKYKIEIEEIMNLYKSYGITLSKPTVKSAINKGNLLLRK
jgi:hypothetical protein